MKPKLIMLVGLPASGKSTIAKELSTKYNANIHSSDELRKELYSDENTQENNNDLFVVLHRRIKEDLKNGKSVIYDATNISYKRRKAFLSELKKIKCEKICIIIATPYEECLKRNKERERQVPEYIIKKMYMNWNTPYWYEGWNDIQIKYEYPVDESLFDYPIRYIDKYIDYNQQNSHHELTLGEHLRDTLAYISNHKRNSYKLRCAATLHDCGKPFTRTFKNTKGEKTEEAHYYQHHCVGAYDSLFYTMNLCKHIDVSILIQWHMQPYFWEKDNNEKQRLKYKKLWGDKLYEDIMLLHEADKLAH